MFDHCRLVEGAPEIVDPDAVVSSESGHEMYVTQDRLIESLEDHDDVQHVYANFESPTRSSQR